MTPTHEEKEGWGKKLTEQIELEYRRCADGEPFRAWRIVEEVDSLLAQRDKELVERVKGRRIEDKKEYQRRFPEQWMDCCGDGETSGYNQALDAVIKLIQER